MRKICTDAEKTLSDDYFFNYNIQKKSVFTNTLEDYAIMTVDTSIKISASAIIVISTTARSVFYVAKYRPKCPVITPIRLCRRARQSNLFRGVFPLFVPGKVTDEWYEDNNTRIHLAIEYGKRKDFIKSGDTVVILFDWGKVFAATKSICVMNIK
ncbi:pyruvate kinase-like [Uloborus diversus]|uniref:pyruvate kinase-like n=1 Tax=Uloborus diversus TaxID=327109 RepID=UPI00240A8BDA|nr:pyruvate kinase-like [Uloborus diversus]